ncbi:aminoglycoside phosphotransferase family protein [Terrabacter sp. 2RAF25]|uniref:aminoglycoside phosphotransferase family protein n=1 Tax=Terrabacter sp. 2RAF25 TaxID=3232998 RepID=UPI003F9CA601
MTVPAGAPAAAATGSTVEVGAASGAVEADDVVAGRSSPEDVCRFLTEVVPVAVAESLGPLLADGVGPVRTHVTRTKLKPGRKLTVSVDLEGSGIPRRPATVTWWAAGEPAAAADPRSSSVAPGLRGPFSTLGPPADASGMTVLIAPLDPAFPHLADAYDPGRLAQILSGAGVAGFEGGVHVRPLRYRPGQRHVLLVESLDGRRTLFVKCYRDDVGQTVVDARSAVAQTLSAPGASARTARLVGYAAAHGLVLWEGEDAAPLSHALLHGHAWTTGRLADLGRAGAALRAIHESGVRSRPDGGTRSDPVAEAAATRRSLEHVAALAPGAAAASEALLAETVVGLVELPDEAGHLLHGDYKCDNLLASADGLVLLDFDRVTVGDPAVDVGKLLADLRWWSRVGRRSPTTPVDAFLRGYGPCPPTRVGRALLYDVVFQLRALGRRIPLHEPGWAEAVGVGLDEALACARDLSREMTRQTHQVLGAKVR